MASAECRRHRVDLDIPLLLLTMEGVAEGAGPHAPYKRCFHQYLVPHYLYAHSALPPPTGGPRSQSGDCGRTSWTRGAFIAACTPKTRREEPRGGASPYSNSSTSMEEDTSVAVAMDEVSKTCARCHLLKVRKAGREGEEGRERCYHVCMVIDGNGEGREGGSH